MANILTCALDDDAIHNGRWVKWVRGIEFKILPRESSRYREELDRQLEPARAIMAVAPESPEALKAYVEAQRKACVKLVVGVRNCEQPDGTPVVFTEAWLASIVARKDFDHLAGWIISEAARVEGYLRAVEEVELGNSEPSSAGL